MEATSFEVDGTRFAYVFYESGLSINVMYGLDGAKKRAVGFKLSVGMDVPAELATRFKFATQKSKLAGTIAELDKHKNAGTTKGLRERARSRVKWLGDVQDGKVTLRFAVEFGDRVPDDVFLDHGLDKDHPDDRHIAGMLAHGDGSAVRQIITADIGMKTRVRGRKLTCESPDDSDRLPDEDDPEVAQLKKEKAELLRQVNRRPDLKLTFEDGAKVLHHPIKLPVEATERYLQKELLEYERKKIHPIEALEVINVTTGKPLRVEGNAKDAATYLDDYKKYLAE